MDSDIYMIEFKYAYSDWKILNLHEFFWQFLLHIYNFTFIRVVQYNDLFQVIRAAEECGNTLARVIPPDQSISILNPISLTAEFPINLAAIKMETKVVESSAERDVRMMMPLMIPGLVKVRQLYSSSLHSFVGFILWMCFL